MQASPPKVPPVTADMETVCTHGNATSTSSSKFFRDEMSRTRVESGGLASINDPVQGKSFVLNLEKKIAIPSMPKPSMPGMPAMPGMPQAPKPGLPQIQAPEIPAAKDLGTKTINGIKVSGKQFTMPSIPGMPKPPAVPGMPKAPSAPGVPQAPGMPKPPGMPALPGMPKPPTSEVWMSHELQLPIQSSMSNPATGTNCVTQMKNVVPGAKLPPSMFQVPPDFKIAVPTPPKPPSPPPPPSPPAQPPSVQAPSLQAPSVKPPSLKPPSLFGNK